VKTPLPIDASIPGLLDSLRKQNNLVVSAAPGAGKTTRLPPAILTVTKGQVWVLEPRRIAAISASQRIADENGWKLGEEVGYQVRFENKSSPRTKLLFLTEALLLRRLLRDPELKEVGCVVLDEFHERSLHVDLALGALRELQELARPDLKIVVMSATLNAGPLATYLGDAPVADIPGKIFPLEIRYEEKSQLLRTGPDFTERMRRLIQKALAEQKEGDLLCFLPGRGEIERLRGDLGAYAEERNIAVLPLHGSLDINEQRAALQPLPGRRKIILSTNVAESSLTVEGVRIVVDSGLQRLAQLHPRTGFESLDLVRISKASAIQRAGRAARRGPGVVYRAWMQFDELSMKDFDPAELYRTDLSESLLLLSALGVSKFESFSWFEAPHPKALASARSFLQAMGAIREDGSLSELGRRLRDFPVHPRLAKLLLAGEAQGIGSFAAELAALLSEPGAKASSAYGEAENDLWLRWEDWKRNAGQMRYRNISRAADQLRGLVNKSESHNNLEEKMPALLLSAYADRLCRRRRAHEPQAKMTGGRGVKLHSDSTVRASEYFVAVEISEGRDVAETLVFQAVGIPNWLIEKDILPRAEAVTQLEWDDEKKRFWALEGKEWQGLKIGSEHRRPAQASEVEGKLTDIAFSRWKRLLADNEALGNWWKRLTFLAKIRDEFPVLEEEKIREALDMATYGENSLEALSKKDLVPFFENLLGGAHKESLNRECPSHWVVPTGNRMQIKYTEDQGPSVEVRLQELFGLASAPTVAGQPLTLFLLAPNYRPVQVTRDLPSFWKNGYPEVRKELRLRYPKHSWPDDPLTAVPQAKGRPRIQ
jgi:ATP-dependent helicase HrpB